jgi:hypothetical protein
VLLGYHDNISHSEKNIISITSDISKYGKEWSVLENLSFVKLLSISLIIS